MEDKEPIQKKLLHAGSGDIPAFSDGAKLTFHYLTRTTEGSIETVDDSRKFSKPMELVIGKKFKLEAWELMLKTMRVGEVARFTVEKQLVTAYPVVAKQLRDIFLPEAQRAPAQHTHMCGFASLQDQALGYPDLDKLLKNPQSLEFTFELLSVTEPEDYRRETWTLSEEEKLARVPQLKQQGNEMYARAEHASAAALYAEAIGILEQLALKEKPGESEHVELERAKIPLLLNFSQCKLLLKEYYAVIEHCTTVLGLDPDNVKALYRRARAHAEVWNGSEARADFARAADLDPSLTAACSKHVKTLAEREKKKEQEDKQKYGSLFT